MLIEGRLTRYMVMISIKIVNAIISFRLLSQLFRDCMERQLQKLGWIGADSSRFGHQLSKTLHNHHNLIM